MNITAGLGVQDRRGTMLGLSELGESADMLQLWMNPLLLEMKTRTYHSYCLTILEDESETLKESETGR